MQHRKTLQKILATTLVVLFGASGAISTVAASDADSMSFVGIKKGRTAKILDDFKDRQDELFFENAPFTAEEEFGLFDAERKMKGLEDVVSRLENARKQYQTRKLEITKEKVSLRTTLKAIDESIDKTLSTIRETEIEIVRKNREISEFQKKITELQGKIASNKKAILDYLSYLYTRGDLVYSDNQEVDVVKSILLNDGNLSDILTDLHYKSLLETAGQNFIEIHRGLVRQYYLDTEKLKAEKIDALRMKGELRNRRKDLDSQYAYKEKILQVTQGREALFNRFIMEKRQRENDLSKRISEIETEYDGVFEAVSKKSGCFIESASGSVSSPAESENVESENVATIVSESKPKKCAELRAFYAAEKTLREEPSANTGSNAFNWPVQPRYLSAYFRDQEYYDSVGSEHEAIDLPVEQGTDIVAPANAYVYFVNPPVEGGYGYVALKHSDGMLTVYGHVSEVLVNRFDFVPAGKVFAKSGGMPGTKGAGVMTSGPHLHFEVHHNRESVDPLRFLDTTYLRYETLDAKYRYKYVEDLKARYGRRANIAGYSSFVISGETEIDRQKYLLSQYAVGAFNDWGVWTEESVSGKIDPSFLMCVGLAETGLGKNMKTAYNVGNVGNTDSGGTYDFVSAREGIYWMAKTLNNQYLGKYESMSDLSRWGNKNGSIYASSSKHWHSNIVRCLSALKGRFIEDDYKFRLSPEETEEGESATAKSVRKKNVVTAKK
jgi:murein DD-endopeptidase MepM/ murein hydrolase activator NlpD